MPKLSNLRCKSVPAEILSKTGVIIKLLPPSSVALNIGGRYATSAPEVLGALYVGICRLAYNEDAVTTGELRTVVKIIGVGDGIVRMSVVFAIILADGKSSEDEIVTPFIFAPEVAREETVVSEITGGNDVDSAA